MTIDTGHDFQHQAQQIETLLSEIQATPDTEIKNKSLALIQAVMDFHSAGIDRMMEVVAESNQASATIFNQFASDDLISSLLLLYGLHPHGLSERVETALNKIRASIQSQGATVKLIQLNDGFVTVALDYNHQGNASSAAALKNAVDEALCQAAPDAVQIMVQEINRPSHLAFIPLTSLRKSDTVTAVK